MAGRPVAPACWQNYLGCSLEQGGVLWVMQCGGAVLAREHGLLCRAPGVMEATWRITTTPEMGIV